MDWSKLLLATNLVAIVALIEIKLSIADQQIHWPEAIRMDQLEILNEILDTTDGIDLNNPKETIAMLHELVHSKPDGEPRRYLTQLEQTVGLFEALIQIDSCNAYTLSQIDIFTRIINSNAAHLKWVRELLRTSGTEAMSKCYNSILKERFQAASLDLKDSKFRGIYQLDSKQIMNQCEIVYGTMEIRDEKWPILIGLLTNNYDHSELMRNWDQFKLFINDLKNQCKAHNLDGFGFLVKFTDVMEFYFANQLNLNDDGPQYFDAKLKDDTRARYKLCHEIIWFGKKESPVSITWMELFKRLAASD